jgi:hypothetical protein
MAGLRDVQSSEGNKFYSRILDSQAIDFFVWLVFDERFELNV